TWPRAHRFIEMRIAENRLTLGLLAKPETDGKLFGAFKGATLATAALMRLLWTAVHNAASSEDLPAGLVGCRPPTRFTFQFDSESSRWVETVEKYLAGESDALLAAFAGNIPAPETLFQANFLAADLETLTLFFKRGPRKIFELHRNESIAERMIPQE